MNAKETGNCAISIEMGDYEKSLLDILSSQAGISPEEYAKGIFLGIKRCITLVDDVRLKAKRILMDIGSDMADIAMGVLQEKGSLAIADSMVSLQGHLTELEKVLDL